MAHFSVLILGGGIGGMSALFECLHGMEASSLLEEGVSIGCISSTDQLHMASVQAFTKKALEIQVTSFCVNTSKLVSRASKTLFALT